MNKNKKVEIPRQETDINTGLTTEEVFARTKAHLDNPVKQGKSRSIASILLSEIFTYFNIIYMMITAVLIAVGETNQLTFLVIIIANTVIGITQKIKSKLTIDKLNLLMKSSVTVIRDGEQSEIVTSALVLDDIMEVSMAKQIGADSVIVRGSCSVNEALLTGESLPVQKQEGDHLLAGSFVVSGSCIARVEKVGNDNYIQKLTSQAKQYKKPKSEILRSINSIIKVIGIALIPIAILLFLRTDDIVKTSGAIIGMIPSGMFLLTSTTLAVSVIRLSKHNILVQELYCIEMLARVTLVCMDKTGTITDGSMKVKETVKLATTLPRPIEDIVGCMLGSVSGDEDNATSFALKEYFTINESLKEVAYHPFSSETKFFAVDYGDAGVYYLGAPEYILNDNELQKYNETINNEASKGYRVLLLGHNAKYDGKHLEQDSVSPVGLVILEDNIRQDAIETITYFKQNGVGVKVISGDNPLTVAEVARRAGVENADKYVSLHEVPDEQVAQMATQYTVFGRVSPQQKEILIKALKKAGSTVAMIGDGVNDILALREADCSIGIGAGSEAARNVSHLILLDSNFANMQNVVSEGRRSTNNLQNTSTMFLTKTIIALTLSIFCILTAFPYPFNPNQLLVLEMFAIGIPSFFYALQQNKNLIKGKFLESVLIKSFNYAISALIFCIPLYLLAVWAGYTVPTIETMIILIVTANSLWVTIRLAIPFNRYRFLVSMSMVILAILGFLLLSDFVGTSMFAGTELFNFLNLVTLSIGELWIICAIIFVLPILHILFTKLNNLIITSLKNRKIQNKEINNK